MKTLINNQIEIADNEQLRITHLFNNQTVPDCSYMGNRNKGTQQVKYVEILMYFALVLIL